MNGDSSNEECRATRSKESEAVNSRGTVAGMKGEREILL